MAHYPPRPNKPKRPVHPAHVAREREGGAFDPHGATDVTYAIHKRLREQQNRGVHDPR